MLLHQLNLQTFKLSRHTDVKKNRKDSLGHIEEKHGTSSRLLSNHRNLLASAVHTVASKRKACVPGTENEQGQRLSKVPSLAPKRPHPLTFPFSTRGGIGEWEPKPVSPGICRPALLPAPAPTPPNSHNRGCSQGQHQGCRAQAFHVNTFARPALERHGARPTMAQGLESAGIARWE